MTVTELLCVRLEENIAREVPDSIFAEVVAERSSLGTESYSPGNDMFDVFHRQYAGVKACVVRGHKLFPKTGCCAYMRYCSYFGFMEHMLEIMEGGECVKAFAWKRRSAQCSRLSLGRTSFAHFDCKLGMTVAEAGSSFMRDVVGAAPTCLHVSLNHQMGACKDERLKQNEVHEMLSDWKYGSSVTFKCSKANIPVRYDVAAVVFCDNRHWVALIVDNAGVKWSYNSSGPPVSPGMLQSHGKGPITSLDGVTIFGVGFSPRVVAYVLTSRMRGTCMPNVDETDSEEDDPMSRSPCYHSDHSVISVISADNVSEVDDGIAVDSPPTVSPPAACRFNHEGGVIRDGTGIAPSRRTMFAAYDTIGYHAEGSSFDDVMEIVPKLTTIVCIQKVQADLVKVFLKDGAIFLVGEGHSGSCSKPQHGASLQPYSAWTWVPLMPDPLTGFAPYPNREFDYSLPHPKYLFKKGDDIHYDPHSHSPAKEPGSCHVVVGVIMSITKDVCGKNVIVEMVSGDTLEVGDNAVSAAGAGMDAPNVFGKLPSSCYYGWQLSSGNLRAEVLLAPKQVPSRESDVEFIFTRRRIFRAGDDITYFPKHHPWNHYANEVKHPLTSILHITNDDNRNRRNVIVSLANGDTLHIGRDGDSGFAGPYGQDGVPLYETSLWEETCPAQVQVINATRAKATRRNVKKVVRQLQKDTAAIGFAGLIKDPVSAKKPFPDQFSKKATTKPAAVPFPFKALCHDWEDQDRGWHWVHDLDEALQIIRSDTGASDLHGSPMQKSTHDDDVPSPEYKFTDRAAAEDAYLYKNNETQQWVWGTLSDVPIVSASDVTSAGNREVFCRGAAGWHWLPVAGILDSTPVASGMYSPDILSAEKTQSPLVASEPRSPKRKCPRNKQDNSRVKPKISCSHDPRSNNVLIIPESQHTTPTKEYFDRTMFTSSSTTDVVSTEHTTCGDTDDDYVRGVVPWRAYPTVTDAATPKHNTCGDTDDDYVRGVVPWRAYPTVTDAATPTSGESTMDSSSSCDRRAERAVPQFVSFPHAGSRAVCVPKGFSNPILFDLTDEMRGAKPRMKWVTANSYYHFEFLHAVEVLAPRLKLLPGGEFFWKKKRNCVVPKSWTNGGQGFPPKHPNTATVMKRFGLRYRCDHFSRSGCPIEMTIRREHFRDKTRDLYSVQFSKGHHLMACNHLATTNPETLTRVPGLHPVIDMWIRDKVAANTDARVGYVYSDLEQSLKQHLMTVTALHCELPMAGPNYIFGCDRSKSENKLCCHQLTYAHVARLPSFSRAQAMPPTELVPQRVGYSSVPYEATCRKYTQINHFLLKDSHSKNGNHQFGPEVLRQIKACIASYNKQLRGDHVISESTTVESGVGPVHACFEDQNLFVRWEKMRNRDPKEHLNLELFEWNPIGLLYRKRSAAQINAANAGGASEVTALEEGDARGVSDPRNLPYEFVAVYASLYSLICGVKAWACRKIMGRVQITADNMYNCLAGVPNMYWFNVGVHDAKNIVFPTVNALQLGRAAPRNEVQCTLPLFLIIVHNLYSGWLDMFAGYRVGVASCARVRPSPFGRNCVGLRE